MFFFVRDSSKRTSAEQPFMTQSVLTLTRIRVGEWVEEGTRLNSEGLLLVNSPIWVFNKSQIKEKTSHNITACSKSHTSVLNAPCFGCQGAFTLRRVRKLEVVQTLRVHRWTLHIFNKRRVGDVAEVVPCR